MKRDILVIDDDESFSWLLEKILKEQFNIVITKDSVSAINWLSKGNLPSIIVCDYRLPIMDGLAFKQNLNISGSYKYIPFILLTALLDDNIEKRCREVGVTEYFEKPFDPPQLVESIHRILGEPKILAQTA